MDVRLKLQTVVAEAKDEGMTLYIERRMKGFSMSIYIYIKYIYICLIDWAIAVRVYQPKTILDDLGCV